LALSPRHQVEVHYVGTLADGKQFDSSRQRHEPFRFRIGDQQVIPGWELSLQKMTLGEKSNVIIPSELGYGKQEIPGVIPADSELRFEIELLNIYRPLKPVVFEEHVHSDSCGHSH
jgi:FKBP-type peptidyl-prolyl cis-trans isomerase